MKIVLGLQARGDGMACLVEPCQRCENRHNHEILNRIPHFNLPERMAFENITPQVEAVVKKSGVKEGLVLVNAMHITASVFINDDESGLHEDYKSGSRDWPRSILRPSATSTTARAKTMPMPT